MIIETASGGDGVSRDGQPSPSVAELPEASSADAGSASFGSADAGSAGEGSADEGSDDAGSVDAGSNNNAGSADESSADEGCSSGDERSGDERSGDERSRDERSGDECSGDESSGDDSVSICEDGPDAQDRYSDGYDSDYQQNLRPDCERMCRACKKLMSAHRTVYQFAGNASGFVRKCPE